MKNEEFVLPLLVQYAIGIILLLLLILDLYLFNLPLYPLHPPGPQVRNYKGGMKRKGMKASKYAPEEGNRYDGIYKVVKYWPEKGSSGFTAWKFMFRRDDEVSCQLCMPIHVVHNAVVP